MEYTIIDETPFSVSELNNFPQEISQHAGIGDCQAHGGVLSDLKHFWITKGPYLHVRNLNSGLKISSWKFGGFLSDSTITINSVKEININKDLPLLIVAINSDLTKGTICVFDCYESKVLRAINVGEQITSLEVIESTGAILRQSPLKYFDGILVIGTLGGNVYLLDICKEICENLQNDDSNNLIRDELNPCNTRILRKEEFLNLNEIIEDIVQDDEHAAIHLNVVKNSSTEHFILKGPDGKDRVHVEKSEVEISALFYSRQIGSILIGYNFGAFQMWNIDNLTLTYTSPICEGNIPITNFAIQEPEDDPKNYCYIWISYSHNLLYQTGLPYAVMYSFYFGKKTTLTINGIGNLYEDFEHCSIRFELELGDINNVLKSDVKGGLCLGIQSIKKNLNTEGRSLALCFISWLIWNSEQKVYSMSLMFDLNQWYKEQLPRTLISYRSSNYMICHHHEELVLNFKINETSLNQFMGIQKLEEHFYPNSLSFELWGIQEGVVLKINRKNAQRKFLDQFNAAKHLAIVKTSNYGKEIVDLGLTPIFCDIQVNNEDPFYQREVLMSVALENNLINWLCVSLAKIADGSFVASGANIYHILNWAFSRAVAIKNGFDEYCTKLFDYSGTRLDENILSIILSGTDQIRNICHIFRYAIDNIGERNNLTNIEEIIEEKKALENIVTYYEVVLWMVDVGLLPERDDSNNFDLIPYSVGYFNEFYNEKRVQLQLNSKDSFIEKDSLLYVDNMINVLDNANFLRQQWQDDGGSGLYPPPSLQSLLRIYLLDGPNLTSKHSFMCYALQDIASTVNDKNISLKLLKFPQVFALKESNVKIMEAIWHLDHNNYEVALSCILERCVQTEDVQKWQHEILMRSLLMQDQNSLALHYLTVQKPPIKDTKDVLTVISLLVSKNMVDEAFKVAFQNKGADEKLIFSHIFNECYKHNVLHTFLYRNLSDDEEKSFLNYLQCGTNSKLEDLEIFYYLLRSRFLEALDTYAQSHRKHPNSQGLFGQDQASIADTVVKIFQKHLPDVAKNFVELVQKERGNLWKQIEKPTPFSVFAHRTSDQVQYKSNIIFAALNKAKHTTTKPMQHADAEITTENIPFLKNPINFKNNFSTTADNNLEATFVQSVIIEQDEEYGPSPCKKLKLSPRKSISASSVLLQKNLSFKLSTSKLSTPIVKRKRKSLDKNNEKILVPQSILKSRNLDDDDEDSIWLNETHDEFDNTGRLSRSSLGLTPRKAIRTPLKSHVKFNVVRESTSTEKSSAEITPQNISEKYSSSAMEEEDHFYSPERSSPAKEIKNFENDDEASKESPVKADKDLNESNNFNSPKARRSIKRSFTEALSPSVRSSPRLAQKTSTEVETESSSLNSAPVSPQVPKLKGRKSLSRSILELNAFSATQLNPKISETIEIKHVESFKEIVKENSEIVKSVERNGEILTSIYKDQEILQKSYCEKNDSTILTVSSEEIVKDGNEDFNVYEDLSSGSEDVRQIIKKLEAEEENVGEFNEETNNVLPKIPEEIIEINSSNSNSEESKKEAERRSCTTNSCTSENSALNVGIIDDLLSSSEDSSNSVATEIVSIQDHDEEKEKIKDTEEMITDLSNPSEECEISNSGDTEIGTIADPDEETEEIKDTESNYSENSRQSIGLQCTIYNRDVTESPKFPLQLRTVKKSYPVRRIVDRTPKLARELTKRTYSRKPSTSEEVEKNGEHDEEVEEKPEHDTLSNISEDNKSTVDSPAFQILLESSKKTYSRKKKQVSSNSSITEENPTTSSVRRSSRIIKKSNPNETLEGKAEIKSSVEELAKNVKPKEKKPPVGRLRSASVDQPLPVPKKRTTRAKSVDLNSTTTESFNPSVSAVTYGSSRRLTRLQTKVLNNIGELEKEVEKLPDMNPIILLYKKEFQGEPDPEEKNIYEPSSSPSVASSTSINSSRKSTTTTGAKRKLRNRSVDTETVASCSPSPPKIIKESAAAAAAAGRRRRRSESVSTIKSINSEASTPRSTRGRKKRDPALKELPKIGEENDDDDDDDEDEEMKNHRSSTRRQFKK